MERDDHKFPDVLSKETTRRGFLKGAAAVAGGAVALATVGGAASPKKAMAQAPKDVMRYLFAERQNCTGCRACEYACSVYHTGVVRPSVARFMCSSTGEWSMCRSSAGTATTPPASKPVPQPPRPSRRTRQATGSFSTRRSAWVPSA